MRIFLLLRGYLTRQSLGFRITFASQHIHRRSYAPCQRLVRQGPLKVRTLTPTTKRIRRTLGRPPRGPRKVRKEEKM